MALGMTDVEAKTIADVKHLVTQEKLLMIGEVLEGEDLATFIARCERCHAVGPVLDPTLYRRGMQRISALAELARAAIQMRAAFVKLEGLLAREEGAAGAGAGRG